MIKLLLLYLELFFNKIKDSHTYYDIGRMITTAMQIVDVNFTKIVDGILGAEGPVFTTDESFYMVAPEVEKNGNAAGQILKVDLPSGKV